MHRALQVLLRCGCYCCCRDESVKEVLKREYTQGIDIIYEVSVTGGWLCCLRGPEALVMLLVAGHVLWCAEEGCRRQRTDAHRASGCADPTGYAWSSTTACCVVVPVAVCWRRHVQHLCGRACAQGCADHNRYDEPVCQWLGAQQLPGAHRWGWVGWARWVGWGGLGARS